MLYMEKNKNYYIMTESARTRFKIWLVKNKMTMEEFSGKIGVSKQYVSKIINGKSHITGKVIEKFRKGGYELI